MPGAANLRASPLGQCKLHRAFPQAPLAFNRSQQSARRAGGFVRPWPNVARLLCKPLRCAFPPCRWVVTDTSLQTSCDAIAMYVSHPAKATDHRAGPDRTWLLIQ